jgi:hypothetical protein
METIAYETNDKKQNSSRRPPRGHACLYRLQDPHRTSPFASPKTSTQEGARRSRGENHYELTARVTAIDAVKRTVTVVGANGDSTTFLCGPEVRNFDQIQVGDQLKVTLTDLLSGAVVDPKNASPDGSSTLLLLAPEGAMPAAAVAETTQITATLPGIDTLRHIASFRYPDGSLHHYAVRPDVDLKSRKLGEKVVIRKTMATAIWVQRS